MRYVLPSLADAGTAIRNRDPFRAASMRGADRLEGTGYLPAEYADELHRRRAELVYVVYSYATPIAWVYESGERVAPRTSYSTSTGRHQGIARSALGIPWEVDRAGDGVTFTATAMPKGARRPDRREVLATGIPGTFDAIWALMHEDHPGYSRWELTAE